MTLREHAGEVPRQATAGDVTEGVDPTGADGGQRRLHVDAGRLEEHLAGARAMHERGALVMVGAYADPTDGALFVFKTEDRAVIEAFVASDPYVKAGLVSEWKIRPWTVVLGG